MHAVLGRYAAAIEQATPFVWIHITADTAAATPEVTAPWSPLSGRYSSQQGSKTVSADGDRGRWGSSGPGSAEDYPEGQK